MASDAEARAAAWRLMEEVAATRLALRRVYELAVETQDAQDCVYLTNVYGRRCIRLVKLLKAEGVEHGRLDAVMNDLLDQVILDIYEEWGIVQIGNQ